MHTKIIQFLPFKKKKMLCCSQISFLICIGFILLQVYWLQKNNKNIIKEIVVLKGLYYAFISGRLDQAIFLNS